MIAEVEACMIYRGLCFNNIMAKELPYFKFEPNQWENGNIQMLSREDKGLFIDICSMYWSRLGDVPAKLAIQKLCAGNATALDSLCDEKIIEVIDDNIYIKFLSEQLNEFEDISKQNSKNALEGWEKRREQKKLSERNASALKSQSESDAIREDKIKEDKIISYIEKDFLKDWTLCRQAFLNKPTNILKLDFNELDIFKQLSKDYVQEDYKNAMRGLFKQKNITFSSMTLKPKHLLENFDKYMTAELSKDYELYGTKNTDNNGKAKI
jgi:hypothetical protein